MQTSTHVIFGATGAIGSAVVKRLSAQGAKLAIVGRRREAVETLATSMGATALVADVTRSEEVDAAVKSALETLGSIDGVVNCVGSVLLKPAHLTKDEELANVLALNLTSSFYILRAAVRAMDKRGGSIVFCSTAAARAGLANHEAIAAAKAGIEGMVLSAAATYASRSIRVNCVAPGLVPSAITARITGNATALAASTAMHALGRIGTPDEIASAIVWFMDPENAWVTAQVLAVDGGLGSLRVR
ncbi:MAG: SDR family oxidoreductase [Clostridia bacterium]|nr:SDR family oxidoreductase [Deltaproteobacteria bacterium]